ncbi:hypothetical protein ACFL6U_23420 [Planctomycetota bacterium]
MRFIYGKGAMSKSTSGKRVAMFAGIRQRLLSGILLLVPFVVTVTVMVWLFGWIQRFVRPGLIGMFRVIETWPVFHQIPVEVIYQSATHSQPRKENQDHAD